MLRRGHGRVTIFHFRNTRISKENSWWSKVGKVITHFSSRRVARILPPPEVTAPFRRDSNDPGRSCGRVNGDGEGSGASGGGRWGGGWRAPPRATGPGAGAAHCWALRGAATRRARAGRRSRSRRWTRAGGAVDVSTCRGPRARRAGIGAGCARPTRAPPTMPAHGGVGRARHAGPRPPSEPTRRSVGGPKAPPGARQPLAPSSTATAVPPNAVPTTPSATGIPPPGTKPPPASPAPATGSNDSHNTPCTCTT